MPKRREYRELPDVDLGRELDEKIRAITVQADRQIEEARVNFRWAEGQVASGAAPLAPADLVKKRKAFAYVTHRDAAGERLLIFSHPNAPAAGLQVPAGTLEDGETPEAGALREAREETGLTDLEVVAFLGEQVRDMRDVGRGELHHRFFFHLRCTGRPPERWRIHEEYPSDQLAAGQVIDPPLFECFWVRLPDGVPALTTDHAHFVPRLISRLHPPPPRPD